MSAEERVLMYLPLVRQIACSLVRHFPPSIELDDLVSEGVLGLYDAIGKFDDAHGVLFATYARFRIRGAILDSLKRSRQDDQHDELAEEVPASTVSLEDVITAQQLLATLSADEREVVLAKYHDDVSLEVIGRRRGQSKQRVARVKDRGILRMRAFARRAAA